jgi:aspartyl aminopeptidase
MLADTQPSCVGGLQNEFIYSGRLDNQMSAYCAIQVSAHVHRSVHLAVPLCFQGLVNSLDSLPNETVVRGALLYDNEEVNGRVYSLAGHSIGRLDRF